MSPKVEHMQLVTVAPIAEELEVNDIVLCQVRGRQYLHLIKAVNGDRLLIGNNRGSVNGWVGRRCIFGKLIEL